MNVDLSGADLSGADLTDADLERADFTGADLTGAILIRAILTGVTLGDTMFDNATWCDGLCTCGDNSIDTCVGCDSIDTCTALNFCEIDCDDGSMCTNDICDPTTLACTHEPVDCDDGNACTEDSCDPAAGCQNPPVNCDDGKLCTDDFCDPATGCQNIPDDCNDGIPCTADLCDQVEGCQHEPMPTECPTEDCLISVCQVDTGCTLKIPEGECNVDPNPPIGKHTNELTTITNETINEFCGTPCTVTSGNFPAGGVCDGMGECLCPSEKCINEILCGEDNPQCDKQSTN